MNAWIVRPFSVEEGVMKDEDVMVKVEFLACEKINMLKADFWDSYLATLWQKAGGEYLILCQRS
jgi:hypothetical protein